MKLDENIMWNIVILPSIETCDYKVSIDGSMTIITLYLNSFDRINEYKTLALQGLKSWKLRNFKVV